MYRGINCIIYFPLFLVTYGKEKIYILKSGFWERSFPWSPMPVPGFQDFSTNLEYFVQTVVDYRQNLTGFLCGQIMNDFERYFV